MSSRGSIIPSFGLFVLLALAAAAVIYFGAIPWALGRVIGATLHMFGLR